MMVLQQNVVMPGIRKHFSQSWSFGQAGQAKIPRLSSLGDSGRTGPAASKTAPLSGVTASRTSASGTAPLAQSPGLFPLISLVVSALL